MTDVKVEDLAKQVSEKVGIDISVERLIEQLANAGVEVSGPQDSITTEQKDKLLRFLATKKDAQSPVKKISLRRKTTDSISVKRDKKKYTVNIVRKKKRTYIQEPELEEENLTETTSSVDQESPLSVKDNVKTAGAIDNVFVTAEQNEITAVDADKSTVVETEENKKEELETTVPSEELLKFGSEKHIDEKKSEESGKDESLEKSASIDISDVTETDVAKEEKADSKEKHGKKASVKPKGKSKAKSDYLYEDDEDRKGKRKGPKKLKSSFDEEVLMRGVKRHKSKSKKYHKDEVDELANKHGFAKPTSPVIKEVTIPEAITVSELAKKLSVKAAEIIKTLMQMGTMATINQVLDQDTAFLIVEEMGHKAVPLQETSVEKDIEIEYKTTPKTRAPVITIMGHVDHGKTSLLDYIRETRVTASESGGITQHIGAYTVNTEKGSMTFLDTPGHSAFTAMRSRGAKCTDIVVLVVAADDGVMPQTIEAIQHAKAANVPIIVAINKMDKPEADPDKVTNELSQYNLIPEAWGGDTQFIHISAKTGANIPDLLDAIILQAELLELKAPTDGPAKGVVIESRLDKGRGVVATILIQSGTLSKGDMVLAGLEIGRVRAMIDDLGKTIEKAGPSTPVEILGLSGTPNAGDEFLVVEDEKKAKEVAEYRQNKDKELKLARQQASKLEGFLDRMKQSDVDVKELNIILKTDVQGSLEALKEALKELSTDEIKVKIIAQAIGGFNESDINLALASEAILIGFNVRADATARKLAQNEGIKLNYFSVIYDVIDYVKSAIQGKTGPKFEEKIIGIAEVRDVFKSSKIGAIAGCMVVDGLIKRGNPIRVLRDNVVIFEGELESLRRFKEDVSEVRKGTECGIGVKNYNDIKPKDQIEVYERVEIKK